VPHLGLGEVATAEMMDACAKAQGVEIRPGDVLLVRTGWYTVFQNDRALWDQGQPGPDPSCTGWLKSEELARDRVFEFLFVAAPLKLTRATGAPFAPLALV
jgi:kynurenine formamidase